VQRRDSKPASALTEWFCVPAGTQRPTDRQLCVTEELPAPEVRGQEERCRTIADLGYLLYSSRDSPLTLLTPHNCPSWRLSAQATLAIPLEPALAVRCTRQSTAQPFPRLLPTSSLPSALLHRATPPPPRLTRRRSLRRVVRGAYLPSPTSPLPACSQRRHGLQLLMRIDRTCMADTQRPLCREQTSSSNPFPSRISSTTTRSTKARETRRSSFVDGEDHRLQEQSHQ
jgi:hypothetical protein